MGIADQFTSDSVPPLRKPSCAISLGGGGGALGGLADAASLLGSADPWLDRLVAIESVSTLCPISDYTTLTIANDSDSPEVALNDVGDIALGYNDDSTYPIITGYVTTVSQCTNNSKVLTVVNGGCALTHLRINQSYDQQTAGDIVSDLTSQAQVDTDTVESGIDLPYYIVDDRQHAFDHIAELAKKCGYVCYFTVEGVLYFGPPDEGEALATFTYGIDVIQLDYREANPVLTKITTIGEGAAGSEGQDAWSWIIKDPSSVKAEAGSGSGVRLIQDPSLRSSDASQSAADSFLQLASRQGIQGKIVVPGNAQVVVGGMIRLAEFRNDTLNNDFFVTAIQHRYSHRKGFISTIDFCSLESDSPGGLGGLL